MISTDWFHRWASYAPDRPALTDADSGRRYTYAQCERIINRTARILRDEFFVLPGDRIAVLSTNQVEYVFLFFAVQKLKALLVPLNYRLTSHEVSHILQDCAPRLFCVQRAFSSVAEGLSHTIRKDVRTLFFDGPDSLTARMEDDRLAADPILYETGLDQPVMILYTSGTTGTPKGALITHGMLFWNSVNTTMRLNLVQQDVTLTFAPFFHTGGWNVLTTPFLHRGAHVILLGKFDPERILQLCDTEGVTILFGVPTMMDRLSQADAFPGAALSTVRYAIVGGEAMPVALIRLWQNKGVPIRQGYGLTEFGPNVFSLNEEDAIRKIGSIGFPNFYVDTRIVDEEADDVAVGEVGELLLRGPVCTPGYWNNPEATAATIRDGWFYTGDLVRRDEEGYYFVVDRKKDMFISGAENVYPAEVEHVLRSHPAVRAAAVIGVPDDRWGEVGKAFLVLNEGGN
ncbi:MAG: AMP-binding protein, partial [Bacteroidetes bacterium]|nr:AMP-binding protein [Bacteroidota bacterium]